MTEAEGILGIPIIRTIKFNQVVDLSHTIHPGIPQWPEDPPAEFIAVAGLERDGYFLRRFSMGEHSGTHMNAPIAFHPDGLTIDAYPVESLLAPAVVIDVKKRCGTNPDYALSTAEILAWEKSNGRVPSDTMVLLHTGWQELWGNPQSYLRAGPNEEPHFPGFSLEAASLLIDGRDVAGLGTDSPGLEPGFDIGFNVNKLLLEQPRIALENLTNLDQLPPTGVTLVIGILRLQGGSGSPVSVMAFIE